MWWNHRTFSFFCWFYSFFLFYLGHFFFSFLVLFRLEQLTEILIFKGAGEKVN